MYSPSGETSTPCGDFGSGIMKSALFATATLIGMILWPLTIFTFFLFFASFASLRQLYTCKKPVSFLDIPASFGGIPTSIPPVYISVLNELVNPQPSETPLPASLKSCIYGGISIVKEAFSSIRPILGSNFHIVTPPRYVSLYSSIG